jgi:tRNA (mo5U34)-methyltransferase
MSPDEIQARIEGHDWFHSIELRPGVVTPGRKSPEVLRAEVERIRLDRIDLRGKSVLDVGAFDGYFSFEAERRGAARVLALDHFVWSLDLIAAARYREQCIELGTEVRSHEEMGFWKPDELPGKRGFDTARELLGSRVEWRVADLSTVDLDSLGQFDVALYLGVLYHMRNPLESLTRLAAVTREVAVIETEAAIVPGHDGEALCKFYEGSGLNADPSNWWVPNEEALYGLCRAAGFRKVDMLVDKPSEPRGRSWWKRVRGKKPRQRSATRYHYRAVAHAWK